MSGRKGRRDGEFSWIRRSGSVGVWESSATAKKSALAGAFALALAQHHEAQRRGAAGAP